MWLLPIRWWSPSSCYSPQSSIQPIQSVSSLSSQSQYCNIHHHHHHQQVNLNLGGLGVMLARAIVDGVAGHGAVFTPAGRLLGPEHLSDHIHLCIMVGCTSDDWNDLKTGDFYPFMRVGDEIPIYDATAVRIKTISFDNGYTLRRFWSGKQLHSWKRSNRRECAWSTNQLLNGGPYIFSTPTCFQNIKWNILYLIQAWGSARLDTPDMLGRSRHDSALGLASLETVLAAFGSFLAVDGASLLPALEHLDPQAVLLLQHARLQCEVKTRLFSL